MPPSHTNRTGPGCRSNVGGGLGVAFALLFIVIGLGIGAWTAWGLVEWVAARDWQPVPARLLGVDLDRRLDSDGQTMYRVVAEYEYRWRGETRIGTRVDLHPGADSLGDYHRRLHARLDAAMRAGEPVTAWVDPDVPARAVLERGMRWGRFALGMLFPLVFGGAGGAILWAMRRAGRARDRLESDRARWPEQPWMWHAPWRTTRIASQGRSRLGVALGFALLWNLVSVPLLLIIPQEFADGNRLALVGLIFPLIGAGLIVWAAREFIRRRRFGDSVLGLDELPVPLGGRLRATLEVPARLSDRQLDVELACMHLYRTGTGRDRRTREDTLWEDHAQVATRAGTHPGGTAARIDMPLPFDQPVARPRPADDRIVWRLTVRADEPGVDFRADFDLPVFETATTAVARADPDAALASRVGRDDWRETGVEHGWVAGGQRFYFPRLRLISAGLGALLFALVFCGVGVGLVLGAGQPIFGGIFALVGGLILWGAVTMLFSRSELVIGNARLRWRHGVVGGWNDCDAGAIKSIDIRRSGSIGRKLYFRVEIERWGQPGRTPIAGWVPGERPARSLAAHLGRLLGVEPPGRPERGRGEA